MLSYEEELSISELLVARRRVTDAVKDQEREPTAEEAQIIKVGNDAAKKLVEAYLPFIRSAASTIIARVADRGNGNSVTYEDLVNEGVIAGMKLTQSFNASGQVDPDGKVIRRGVRFATYSGKAINKAMNRLISKMSTLVRIDIDVIQATWAWLAAKEDLKRSLGRTPTVEEIEEYTSINSEYIAEDLPHRSSMMNMDNPDEVNDVMSPVERAAVIQAEQDHFSAILRQVLVKVYSEDLANGISLYLGLDRMYPRSSKDLSEALGISNIRAVEMITFIEDALIHPKFRVKMQRELVTLGYTL